MQNYYRYILALAITISSVTSIAAQKYGHTNFGNLVSSMPEVKAADQQLVQFNKELTSKGESMVADFQKKYIKFTEDVQSGVLAPREQREQEQALQKEQQGIIQYEREITKKLEEKRQELLRPIVAKVELAVEDVAKENGYQLIFDTSLFNAVLMADESIDITSQVRAKLGL